MCENNKQSNTTDRVYDTIKEETSMREATFEEAVILSLNEIQESLMTIYEMLKETKE